MTKYLSDTVLGEKMENDELEEGIYNMLRSLTPEQKKVLELKYSHSNPMTYDEVAKSMNKTREQIRCIQAIALRRLRHPSRLNQLINLL